MPRDNEKEKDDFSVRFLSKVGRSLSNDLNLSGRRRDSRELGVKRGSKGLFWTRPSKRNSLGLSDAGSAEDSKKDEFEDAKEGEVEEKEKNDAADDGGEDSKEETAADSSGEKKAGEKGESSTAKTDEAKNKMEEEKEDGESSTAVVATKKKKKKDEADSKVENEPKSPSSRGRKDSFLIKLTEEQNKKLKFSPF